MAEISTIARPYAEALLKAVKESKEEGLAQKLIPVLDTIDEIVADPKLKELASDPSLSSDQIYELIRGMLDKAVPQEVAYLNTALDTMLPVIKLLPNLLLFNYLMGGFLLLSGTRFLMEQLRRGLQRCSLPSQVNYGVEKLCNSIRVRLASC